MNYQILKSLIESLVLNFNCPNCGNKIIDNNLEIIGARGNNINLDIFCNNCQKHTFLKAEVNQLNLFNIKKEELDKIKDSFLNIYSKIKQTKVSILDDKEILNLKNILDKENLSVKDFLE